MSLAVKLARITRDWTQEQLGEQCGLTQGDVSRVENGWVPPPDVAKRLAKALGRTVDALFEEYGRDD